MKYAPLGLAGGLFYAAPIGAGLTGASYFAVVPFTGLFFLWVLVMRYAPFKDGAAFVLPTIVVHVALASMCLGFGHLLRGLFQVEATAPLLGWLVMGLGGLALGRIMWKPRQDAETEALLETALRKLNEFADDAEEIVEQDPDLPLKHPTTAEAAALAIAYGNLDAMSADAATEAGIRQIVLPLDAEIRAHILLDAFINRAERTETRRDRHAALILASDGGLAWRQLDDDRMAQVFDLIVKNADTVTLAHFLTAADNLLRDFPTTWSTLPPVDRLLDVARQIEGGHHELSDALVDLAHRVENLEREPEQDG